MIRYVDSGDSHYDICKHLIPTAIQLEELFEKNKPTFDYRADFFLHLIHLTIEIPAKNKSLRRDDGFVPLNAQLLQKKEPNYRRYLDYLVNNDILEENPSYLPGSHSRSFRISKAYLTKSLSQVIIGDKKLKKSIASDYAIKPSDKKRYGYLFKWLNEGLQINVEDALNYCLKDLLLDGYKECYEGYYKAYAKVWKIRQLEAGKFWFKVDNFGRRLHTNLTGLDSDLKKFLRYKGQELVSIDLKNSQPYLGIKIIRDELKIWKSEYKPLKIATDTPIMLSESAETVVPIDVQHYIGLVCSGGFYEYMEEKIKKEISQDYFMRPYIFDFDQSEVIRNTKKPRAITKGIMFQVLFSKNSSIRPEKQVFKKYFPTAMMVFEKVKGNMHINTTERHKELAKKLQRIEASVVLDKASKQISKEYPDVPLFTIHDSIMTTVGNEKYVEEVLRKAFEKEIGYAPSLEVVYHNSSHNEEVILRAA